MPRFTCLTVEEARTLSRNQLLPRIEDEQKYWYGRMNRGEMRVGDDEAFKTFNRILHVVTGPGRSAADAADAGSLLDDDPRDRDHWTKPLGELGDL
ncbi:hypothetical protein ACIBCT_14595 [Streptosporangium sp. NPDC050855]|uniref:hypothetical protein n=1 Tax=Streptosporangium sp. NPDC050855 TaxID=3366194 RepID=UPI0037934552